MATCGNCKAQGQSIEHVRECFASKNATLTVATVELTGFTKGYVDSRDFKPMVLAEDVPDSKYAIEGDSGLVFYEVSTGSKGKWKGFQFLDRLTGAPGDWRKTAVKGAAKHNVLTTIATDAKAAAIRFSKEFTICAVCSSPLSDPISRELGLGPVCAKRF